MRTEETFKMAKYHSSHAHTAEQRRAAAHLAQQMQERQWRKERDRNDRMDMISALLLGAVGISLVGFGFILMFG